GILGVVAADVHVDAVAPVAPVADAAAIVRSEDNVALLQQVLMKAVVDGVVSLHVPAAIVLIYAITVDPNDGGMLFRAVEILGDEEPAGNLLAISAWETHELGLDELGTVHAGRHGIGEAHCLRARTGVDDKEVGAVVCVGVLVDEELIVGRPVRFDVCARAGSDVGYRRVRGTVADAGDADVAIAEVVGFVGVESK